MKYFCEICRYQSYVDSFIILISAIIIVKLYVIVLHYGRMPIFPWYSLFTVFLIAINNKLQQLSVRILFADRTVRLYTHMYVHTSVRLHCSFQSAETKKLKNESYGGNVKRNVSKRLCRLDSSLST